MGLKLNVGCGPVRTEGEVGVDRLPTSAADVVADLLALPFPDGAAEFVRLDHVLEHLPQRMGVPALLEARRVLQPGGRIRVSLPDLAATCRAYAAASARGGLAEKAAVLRQLYGSQAHDGEYHQAGWDGETLADLLVSCGFVDVRVEPDPGRDEGTCVRAEAVRP